MFCYVCDMSDRRNPRYLRTQRVAVLFTPPEESKIVEFAQAMGMTISTAVRHLALENLRDREEGTTPRIPRQRGLFSDN